MPEAEPTCFTLLDARVAVRSELRGVLEWLEEFLVPGFERVVPGSDDLCVTVRQPPQSGPDPPVPGDDDLGLVACFALDREVVHHRGRRVGEAVELLDDKLGARYLVGDRSVRVTPHGPDPHPRVAAMRVVRELAVTQALNARRRVQLHASGIERGGRVALFAGPKEAGKTTLVARVASTTGDALVANDRVLVSRADASSPSWDVRPVPTIVSVRPGTVRRLPRLFDDVPAVERPAHLTRAEAAEALKRSGRASDQPPVRLKLSPPQLADAVGTKLSPGGELATLALVVVDGAADRVEVRRLAVDELDQRLAVVRYGAHVGHRPRTAFEAMLGFTSSAAAEVETLETLAADVTCLEVRVGPGILDDDVAAVRLADALFDGVDG